MGIIRLIWRNISGNIFRSLAILLCSGLVSALAISATFVVRGAEASLHTNLDRLGADILVLPWGTMTEKIGGVRLMSAAVDGWMPAVTVEQLAGLEGVAAVSPQLYLATLKDSHYSEQVDLYLVAFNPETDFTVRPWRLHPDRGLAVGEAVAGAQVDISGGSTGSGRLDPYGYSLIVVDRLEPTGTTIDRTVFVNFATAQHMWDWSLAQDRELFKIMPGAVSAVMVRADHASDPHDVAIRILDEVRGAVPLETPNLFQTERRQMIGVLRTLVTALALIWALAMAFMGLVFSISVHERRWEIGVLRAIGFTRRLVLRSLLLEGTALALAGGLLGTLVTMAVFISLNRALVNLLRLPLDLPSPPGILLLVVTGQLFALGSVLLAAFIPAWRISRQEVALTMRE